MGWLLGQGGISSCGDGVQSPSRCRPGGNSGPGIRKPLALSLWQISPPWASISSARKWGGGTDDSSNADPPTVAPGGRPQELEDPFSLRTSSIRVPDRGWGPGLGPALVDTCQLITAHRRGDQDAGEREPSEGASRRHGPAGAHQRLPRGRTPLRSHCRIGDCDCGRFSSLQNERVEMISEPK